MGFQGNKVNSDREVMNVVERMILINSVKKRKKKKNDTNWTQLCKYICPAQLKYICPLPNSKKKKRKKKFKYFLKFTVRNGKS